ncbi:hypothetical protein [Shewanella psychrophila]|uniref:hypothetical protein n=1 Tax=Shewanella psychrophila TaxID=225848 RepID=UPI001F32D79D|nr:hypothetical protein [Shewanella psychrophila]
MIRQVSMFLSRNVFLVSKIQNRRSNFLETRTGVNAAVTFDIRDDVAEPTGIVLAACHRSVCTFSEPQAKDNHEDKVFSKPSKYQTSPMNPL